MPIQFGILWKRIIVHCGKVFLFAELEELSNCPGEKAWFSLPIPARNISKIICGLPLHANFYDLRKFSEKYYQIPDLNDVRS